MVVDQITENPVAGSSFNVSGRVVSDNGSGLENRDGSTLISNVLFTIDDLPTGFGGNGSVQSGVTGLLSLRSLQALSVGILGSIDCSNCKLLYWLKEQFNLR